MKPFESIPTNCTPSSDSAFRLGNPYLQFTKLLLHSGECQRRRPAVGICHRHRSCRERDDGVPSKFEEPIAIFQRGQSASDFHVPSGPG
jgi:hypothetical protein